MNSHRVVKAILIAPLSAFPVIVIPMLFMEPMWGLVPLAGVVAVAVSYIGMLVIGIPSISLLVYLRATRWWQLTLAGAVGGACMSLVANGQIISAIGGSAGLFGAVVAAVTWYIAFRRLPTIAAPGQP